MTGVATNAATFDAVIPEDSPMAGRPLREASLPEGSIVLAIQRDTELLATSGDVTLAPGDLLTALARPDHAAELHAALGTSP